MSALPSAPSRPLPPVLQWAASFVILAHLCAIGVRALAAPSGPWPTNFGAPSDSPPPMFAGMLAEKIVLPGYLEPLHLWSDYHFQSNRTPQHAAYFEVHLKDRLGGEQVLRFPDEKANFWVRQRQRQLAVWLAEDEPLQPRGVEKIAAPRQKADEVEFWEMTEPNVLRLKRMPEHLAPRNQETIRPTERAKLLAAAYVRYLCREHGAQSAELVRCSRPTILPMVLFLPEPPTEESLATLKSYFGEYRREK